MIYHFYYENFYYYFLSYFKTIENYQYTSFIMNHLAEIFHFRN